MKITEVKVYPFTSKYSTQNGCRLKAYAAIVFEHSFIIHDLKLIEGDKGLFVCMPSRRLRGMYRDIVHPLNAETRRVIENSIIDEYAKMAA
jgi:stage V sporulation protein G